MADGDVIITVGADDSEIKGKFDEISEEIENFEKETEKSVSAIDELRKTIDKQSGELKELKEEYSDVVLSQGKSSKAAKDLKEKIRQLSDELDENKNKLNDAENAAENAGKGFDSADVAAGVLVANGLSALISKLTETASSFLSLADETREYREDMAKLDSAFTASGHSTETAQKAYDGFYKILGESDRTVEAVNHLAEFTKSEEELAQWSTICAGVTAKFGDSLPIEGLTEAANETAKVGAVTGPLADALNWAGVSEDEFNKKLAKCRTEQERASLITKTLNGLYEDEAAKYNELTASTQEARAATNKMEQAQAAVGATLEPLTTAWTNLKAGAMQWVADVGLPSLQKGWEWLLNNIPGVIALVGALTTAWLTFGGAQKLVDTWNKLVAISQGILNAVMNANPIMLIVTAIAALVTAFILLWNNCEGFRNFFINLWENIKNAVMVAVNAIAGFFTGLWDGIVAVWNSVAGWFNTNVIQPILNFFKGLWNGIVAAYHAVIDPWIEIFKRIAVIVYDNIIKPIADFFIGLWDGLVSGATACWDGIVSIWNVVSGWFSTYIIKPVANFFSGLWDGIVSAASGAWNGIKSVFSAVASFFGNIFSAAWEKVKAVFSVGGKIFDGIKDGIVTAFKTVVNAIITGINKVIKLPFEGLNGILNTIQGISIVGVKPFSWLSWRAPVPQLPHLAQGAVISPNDPFLAVLGDQKRGTNIETPLDTMIQAFNTALDKREPGKGYGSSRYMLVDGISTGITKDINNSISEIKKLGSEMLTELSKQSTDKVKNLEAEIEALTKARENAYKDEIKALEKKIDTLSDSEDKEDKARKKALEKELKALKEKKEILQEELAEKKEAVQKELKLEQEKEKALTKYVDTFDKQMAKFTTLEEKYAEKSKSILEKLESDIQSEKDNYSEAVKSRTEALADSLDLFSYAERGEKVSGYTLRKNLRSQISILKDYDKQLAKLSEKGISEDFINEIKGKGLDALPALTAINKMTEKQLTEYVGLWEEKNALANSAATSELESLKGETEDNIAKLKETAGKELEGLRSEYRTELLLLSEELSTSLKESGEAGLVELGNFVTQYVDMGKDLMNGVAEGIETQEAGVISSMVNGIKRALEAAKAEMGIHSPSDVTKDELGGNMALGVGEGWKEKLRNIKSSLSSSLSDTIANLRATVAAETSRFAVAGVPDNGFFDLAQAVGTQTAGINSLASFYRSGGNNQKTIVLKVGEREFGSAVVDLGEAEQFRRGVKMQTKGVSK